MPALATATRPYSTFVETRKSHPFLREFLGVLFVFVFLGLYPRHMEVPRLGVESELQLPAYTTATVTPDPRSICDLCRSLWQCWILNPLSEVRIKPASSQKLCWVLNPLSHIRNSYIVLLDLPFGIICDCSIPVYFRDTTLSSQSHHSSSPDS